jgi:hypothetical protein
LVAALVGRFPTLEQVVGSAWLRGAALAYAREHPPAAPALWRYGADFGTWLRDFGPARDLPYLPGLADCESLTFESLFARDAPALEAQGFQAAVAEGAPVCAHPAFRYLETPDNTPSLFLALRSPSPPDALEYEPAPGLLLCARPFDTTVIATADPECAPLVRALGAGEPLLEAAALALQTAAPEKVQAVVAQLLDMGALDLRSGEEGKVR